LQSLQNNRNFSAQLSLLYEPMRAVAVITDLVYTYFNLLIKVLINTVINTHIINIC